MTTMTIGIVDTGRMALRLAALFANQGHDAVVRKPLSSPHLRAGAAVARVALAHKPFEQMKENQ